MCDQEVTVSEKCNRISQYLYLIDGVEDVGVTTVQDKHVFTVDFEDE